MKRAMATLLGLAVLAGCATTPSVPIGSLSPTSLPSLAPLALGAGFRYSTYGIGRGLDPGPAYWLDVGQAMASRFPGATPQAIWIVSEYATVGTVLTFPGYIDDVTIHFRSEDNNEAALTLFDQEGVDVWLQLEPGAAPMETLIDLVLDRYEGHPSVIGVGVDVEWYQSTGDPEGEPVTDAEARAWVQAVRAHNPTYRLFLKHYDVDWMPPTEREGIVFVNDAQDHASLAAMVDEFAAWGETFAPAQVGYQFGYLADAEWWRALDDPPRDIGQAILDRVPNAAGLYWVDFTVKEVFPPGS